MRRLLGRQRGTALILALAFMVLAVPLVTTALGLASVLNIDSRLKTATLRSHYSTSGGIDHAIFRLMYEPNYASGLSLGIPNVYTITLNGTSTSVTVVKESEIPPVSPPPPDADSSRRLQVSKVVSPTTALPLVATLFTYTIDVENRDDESENLNQIYDVLPPGFSYLPLSTQGVTTKEPLVSGQQLTWDVANMNITVPSRGKVTLSFKATASVGEGNYCNEAWVHPFGIMTSSGQTAMVKVGNPANDLCQGAAARVTKTVSPSVAPADTQITSVYTITIQNYGTAVLNMSRIRDLLPGSFLYVDGSTSGTVTSVDPSAVMFQGRQRLDWTFSPLHQIQPGETRTLVFKATAKVPGGTYWNEVWVTFNEFLYAKYTWPTAPVKTMGVFRIRANDGQTTVTAVLWVDGTSYTLGNWELVRTQ